MTSTWSLVKINPIEIYRNPHGLIAHWNPRYPIYPIGSWSHQLFSPRSPSQKLGTHTNRLASAAASRAGLVSRLGAALGMDGRNHPHMCNYNPHVGVSENSVPLNPMVNDHYPY